jgi:hypothetical protein
MLFGPPSLDNLVFLHFLTARRRRCLHLHCSFQVLHRLVKGRLRYAIPAFIFDTITHLDERPLAALYL